MRGTFSAARAPHRWHSLLWGVLLLLVFPAFGQEEPPAAGSDESSGFSLESMEPVILQNSIDGWLWGLKGRVAFHDLELFAGSGYGWDSERWRYQVGLGWQETSVLMKDWPDTAILGRVGEMGYSLENKMEHNQSAVRWVELWPVEGEERGPQVGYAQSHSSYTLEGAFDFSLNFNGDNTIGTLTDGRLFESTRYDVKARFGDFRLGFSAGTSSNEAQLPGFEFTQGMRGYDEPLKGHSFWRVRPERRALLASLPIPLGPLVVDLPNAEQFKDLTLNVEASAFGELLYVQPNPTPLDADPSLVEPQSRLGWGVGLVFSLNKFDFELRLDLFFNADGKMSPLFG